MPSRKRSWAALVPLLLSMGTFAAEPRPWHIYLLFGQSNMAGGATAEAQDKITHPRVKVLAYDNCSNQGRTYNQWYQASPSLHLCGTGMGLGDWFGRIVADSMSQDTIALIPCAIPGVDIDFFRKDVVSARRGEFRIPPDNHWTGAYPWMLERLKLAQKKGVIKGVLLHQGEADWQDAARKAWPAKVAGILSDLKADLGMGDVPLLVGELRRDGCCGAHNPYVATLAKSVPNGHVISSEGLAVVTTDAYHFNTAGLREFGKRYASTMVKQLRIPTSVASDPAPAATPWRVGGAKSLRLVEFDKPQRWISLTDAEGRRVAAGAGSALRIPAATRGGMLFVQSDDGIRRSSGAFLHIP
jgi:hypothetical protein